MQLLKAASCYYTIGQQTDMASAAAAIAVRGGIAFRRDLSKSERNYFKVDLTRVTINAAKKKKKKRSAKAAAPDETSLLVCIANVPSRLLAERRPANIINRILGVLKQETGFSFGADNTAVVRRRSFCVECSYILRSKTRPDHFRSWTGSFNVHNSRRRAGVVKIGRGSSLPASWPRRWRT